MTRSSSTDRRNTRWGCVAAVLSLVCVCPILILLLVAHTPVQPTRDTSSTWNLVELAGFMLLVKLGFLGGYVFMSGSTMNAVYGPFDRHVLRDAVGLLLFAAEGIVGFFALLYWKYSQLHSDAFNNGRTAAALSKIDTIYFALTTFTTTGYGDIRPLTSAARGLVSLQMAVGFIAVVFGVTLLFARVMPMFMERDQARGFLNLFPDNSSAAKINRDDKKEDPK
jgi:voltage-gated potassium channel Kch